MHVLNIAGIILSALSLLLVSPACANDLQPDKARKLGNAVHSSEVSWHSISQDTELPNLPRYSGRTHFNFGSVNQHARGGPVYSLSYDAGEERDIVLTWYRDALTAMKWELDKEALKSGYVAATDGSGNMVHIAVTNSALKGARCNFMIQYKLRHRSV